ncbi:urease accessory protein UreD [Streptomyces sp. NPDC017979]|uniref:urease accessory protein UreD n=1 Tax=Streptomyces sp. NPDC017979 TaxID=3365024 RepID=UPI0037BCF7F1
MSVRATARVVADRTGLPVLAGAGPLAPRRTRSLTPGRQRVVIVGAMSAPLGGDRLAVETEVRAGARLEVGSAAATLSLPGPTGAPAHYDLHLTVGDGARLHWLPEPVVCVRGSDLRTATRVELAPTARLVLREEHVLGRHREEPGTVWSRLTVRRAGRTVLDQEGRYGPGAPGGWDGGAVIGGHRAVGQLLIVDPAYETEPPRARLLGDTAVLTPLAGPAALVTAVAPDARLLRAVLDAAQRAEDRG